jgi:hypothetical protein
MHGRRKSLERTPDRSQKRIRRGFMDTKEKLDIDIFKVVTGAIVESSNLEDMANSLI